MLYLDSSALVKLYSKEAGSAALQSRLKVGDKLFTSALTYAEVFATLARHQRERRIQQRIFDQLSDAFVNDWTYLLNVLEVDTRILTGLRELVTRFPLKASDAIQLSSALWLRDTCRANPGFASGDIHLEFAVADSSLAAVAAQCGLNVFNPESAM
jgi:predicted nucleic acid-binding protein